MQNPNPIITTEHTLEGHKLIIEGLRKLPVERVEGLLAEHIGQLNKFINEAEAKEKAEVTAAVVVPLRKSKKGASAEPPPVDNSDPVL